MLESITELRELLADTFLAKNRVAVATVSDTQESVFAIEVEENAMRAWTLMRQLLSTTGRWPVLTLLDAVRSDTWEAQVRSADLFSRFYFAEERKDARKDDSPGAILQASEGLDVSALLAGFEEDNSISLEDYLTVTVEGTESRFGKAPLVRDPLSFLRDHSLRTLEDIERWFFEWELANCPDPLALPEHGLSHISWFEDKRAKQALLLMPSPYGWEVPAYINWYGSYLCHSQFIVALFREWHSKYGAELVAHDGTMLQFQVARRPQTAQEAFHLAWQQHMIAPCTTILPGVSPRDHARALLHTDKWFLHERP